MVGKVAFDQGTLADYDIQKKIDTMRGEILEVLQKNHAELMDEIRKIA